MSLSGHRAPDTDTEHTEQNQADERLALAIEGANDGLWDWDIPANKVYYSPRWKAMLGYANDEISDDFDEWTRRIHPDDRERCLAAIAEHLNSPDNVYRLEHRLRHKDGSWRWILTRAASLRDATGRAYRIAGWHTDITNRKVRESQVKERERQYHDIFASTSDGLILNDLKTGRVVEANPAACAMHGYSHREFIGLHPTAFIAPAYHEAFARYMDAAREGRSFRAHAVDVRRDGSELHVEIHGSTIAYAGRTCVLGVVRDISERVSYYRELERRVRQRTKELTTLLDVARSVVSTLDLQPLLKTILDQLKTVVDYSGAAIIAREGDALALLDYRGPTREPEIHALERSADFQMVLRNFLDEHEVRVVGDVRGDEPGAAAFRRAAGAFLATEFAFVRSWMGLPLIAKERVIGMLNVVHAEPNYFTERHAALATAVAGQAAVALENARLYEQGKDLAALEERQRLARELHDSVSQALFGITLGARTARTMLDRDPARAAEPLEYAMSLAEAALAEMRALIFELRPESLANEGLIVALEKLAAAARARHHVEVHTALTDEPNITLEAKEALYRIAQEALQNVVRHARATEVSLSVAPSENTENDELVMDIRDNGIGFDPSESFPGHVGLNSMRERMPRLGGTFSLESVPEEGTHIVATIPLPPSEAENAG
jgi:PAS domain S-box-containing protein